MRSRAGSWRATQRSGIEAACLAMAFKLALSAQDHWRKVNVPHLVALVRAGARFKDGAVVDAHSIEERSDQVAEEIVACPVHNI